MIGELTVHKINFLISTFYLKKCMLICTYRVEYFLSVMMSDCLVWPSAQNTRQRSRLKCTRQRQPGCPRDETPQCWGELHCVCLQERHREAHPLLVPLLRVLSWCSLVCYCFLQPETSTEWLSFLIRVILYCLYLRLPFCYAYHKLPKPTLPEQVRLPTWEDRGTTSGWMPIVSPTLPRRR